MADTADASNILDPCKICGERHVGRCMQIRSIEYYPNGMIKKIEYKNEQVEKEGGKYG